MSLLIKTAKMHILWAKRTVSSPKILYVIEVSKKTLEMHASGTDVFDVYSLF